MSPPPTVACYPSKPLAPLHSDFLFSCVLGLTTIALPRPRAPRLPIVSRTYSYPGKCGPLMSVRAENFRDGMEDYSLFRRLPPAKRRALVQAALSYSTGFPGAAARPLGMNITVTPAGLEALRRGAVPLLAAES